MLAQLGGFALGRPETITHKVTGGATLLQIDYEYSINNWVAQRTETDYTVLPSVTTVVTFAYDDRGRLIGETRVEGGTTTKYDLDYTYDQVGNRLTKSDAVAGLYTFYHYDVHTDPNEMEDATYHNRLLYYEVYDGDDPNADNLLRTVRYTYYETGWASNISIKDEYVAGVTGGTAGDYDYVQDLALYYYTNGMLWRAIRGAWEVDEYGEVVSNSYTADRAWEFRYDGSPRARYLTVEYDLTGQGVEPDSPGTWVRDGALHWTDYLGDMPWGDLDVDAGGVGDWEDADEVMRYLGLAAQQTADVAADEQYYHEDLIGSTMLTTDDSANDVSTATYTAFGEILDGSGSPGGDPPSGFPRYQYAGGYGYESGILSLTGVNTALAPITLQHLGWRWYQPDIGRFVQRDPIGVFGGPNVYGYTHNNPSRVVDPAGLLDVRGDAPPIIWTTPGLQLSKPGRVWVDVRGAKAWDWQEGGTGYAGGCLLLLTLDEILRWPVPDMPRIDWPTLEDILNGMTPEIPNVYKPW